MLFPVALTTLLSLAAVVVATPANVGRLYGLESPSTGRKCGSSPTPEDIIEKEKAFTSLLAENKASGKVSAFDVLDVPVYFHVISNDTDGDIP